MGSFFRDAQVFAWVLVAGIRTCGLRRAVLFTCLLSKEMGGEVTFMYRI